MALLDSIDRLRGSLDYHLARQNILASNLAHVDTPGYKPLDVQRRSEFQNVLHATLRATDPRHIGPTVDGKTSPGQVIEDRSSPAGADGNAVNLDREAVKIASNHMRYDAIASLVGSKLSGLIWAATDARQG
jgi:flagellar basal-body rod protein FlgB